MLSKSPSILIVRFSSLGDVVMATSAARYIKAQRPGAKVHFATKAALAPLLEGQPDLDAVWALDEAGLDGLRRRALAAGVDGYLDLHGSIRSRLLGLRLNASESRRWHSEGWNRRLRVSLPALKLAQPAPVIRRYVEAAASLLGEAPPADTPLPRLAVDPAAWAWAQDWLRAQGWREGQRLLAVAPGAAWPTKQWGPEHLAQCLALVSEFDKVRFVLLGTKAEAALAASVKAYMKKGAENAFLAGGETQDLRRLAALISLCHGFLGHDSGPMHVAEALGVPITALFGPTVEAFGFYPQGPGHQVFDRDLACRPCSVHGSKACPLGHHACLEGIEPFDVAKHLRRQLRLEAA